jgi:hypothetical protein
MERYGSFETIRILFYEREGAVPCDAGGIRRSRTEGPRWLRAPGRGTDGTKIPKQ